MSHILHTVNALHTVFECISDDPFLCHPVHISLMLWRDRLNHWKGEGEREEREGERPGVRAEKGYCVLYSVH